MIRREGSTVACLSKLEERVWANQNNTWYTAEMLNSPNALPRYCVRLPWSARPCPCFSPLAALIWYIRNEYYRCSHPIRTRYFLQGIPGSEDCSCCLLQDKHFVVVLRSSCWLEPVTRQLLYAWACGSHSC